MADLAETESKFDTVASVRKVVENMQTIENIRARDRALIDTLANGERPYTPDEVEKYQIKYNINWGEMSQQIQTANRQMNEALIFKEQLFTATSKCGIVEKRDDYSQKFTDVINSEITEGDKGRFHDTLLKSRNASTVLHGVGVMYWPNDYDPIPKFVPLENFLTPTDTLVDFSNLTFFNIRTELTPYELYERTHGDAVDKGWDVTQVEAILQGLDDLGEVNPQNYDWLRNPEKMQEIFKQNRCYLNSDVVAKIKLNYFYSRDDDDESWYLKIYMQESVGEADADKYVYRSDGPVADTISKIIHITYGNMSVVAPLTIHSVRGLGQSLYSPSEALNRFRSGLFQHGEEQLRMYFYLTGTPDKARKNVIELFQYGIIEDGVKIVPESERHQVDAQLIDSIMAQCRQNLSENASSFVQDIDDGTEKEKTLGEVQIRQQTATINLSSMLASMYRSEGFYYSEVTRRFLQKNTGYKRVDEFQKKCVSAGIPEELLTFDNWKVAVVQVMGSGNQSLATQEVGALMAARSQFDPKSQRQILRMFASTVTKDPSKGQSLVPDAKDDSTDGSKNAEDVFGTLMQGVPVGMREGIEQIDYITTLLKNAGMITQRITQTDNVGAPQDVLGLSTVLNDAQQHLQILAADPKMKQEVKQLGDAIGQLENLVKAFGQRQQAAGKQQNPKLIENLNFKDLEAYPQAQAAFLQMAGLPPVKDPQSDPKVIKAQQSLAINQAKFEQKTTQSQIAFEIDQINKLSAHQQDLTQAQREHNQELIHAAAQKIQELLLAAQQTAPAAPPANN